MEKVHGQAHFRCYVLCAETVDFGSTVWETVSRSLAVLPPELMVFRRPLTRLHNGKQLLQKVMHASRFGRCLRYLGEFHDIMHHLGDKCRVVLSTDRR